MDGISNLLAIVGVVLLLMSFIALFAPQWMRLSSRWWSIPLFVLGASFAAVGFGAAVDKVTAQLDRGYLRNPHLTQTANPKGEGVFVLAPGRRFLWLVLGDSVYPLNEASQRATPSLPRPPDHIWKRVGLAGSEEALELIHGPERNTVADDAVRRAREHSRAIEESREKLLERGKEGGTQEGAIREFRKEQLERSKERGGCLTVSRELLNAIGSDLRVYGGGTIRRGAAVRSGAHSNAYFVAAEIDGPDLEGDGDIGIWITNKLHPPLGMILAVDGIAKEFSVYPDAERSDAQATIFDPGARESRGCLE